MPSKIFIESNSDAYVSTNIKINARSMKLIRDLASKTDRRISEITAMLIDFALEHVEIKKRTIPVYELQFNLPTESNGEAEREMVGDCK